jgi:hypothetical protein
MRKMSPVFEIKMGGVTLSVSADPLVDDGYIDVKEVWFGGVDIWPVLAECEEMADLIVKLVEEKIPDFSALVSIKYWEQQDESMFKYGR